jgi:hypothetical protein
VLLALRGGDGVRAHHRDHAHLRDAAADELLAHQVVDGLEEHVVALGVGHRHRRGRDAGQGEQRHLDLREGPAHRVGVHAGQPELGGDHEREERVHPAVLDRQHGDARAAQVVLQRAQDLLGLAAVGELLHDRGGRADHGDREEQALRVQVGGVHHLDGPVLLDRLLQHDLGDVGVATATGAEDHGPQGQVLDVVQGYVCHELTSR